MAIASVLVSLASTAIAACSSDNKDSEPPPGGGSPDGGGGSSDAPSGSITDGRTTNPQSGPAAGNPGGKCEVPAEARAEDVSNPRTVVGTGTKESCTGDAFVAAVAKGGVITFDCGPDPATITLTTTAKIRNDTGPSIVIDGGGKVTLSGGGKIRILYMNTCDEAQSSLASSAPPARTAADCNDFDVPRLTLQNLTFVDGNAKGLEHGKDNKGGGGAVYVLGGRLKIVNARFFNNVCDDLGSDVGGGAVRVLDFGAVHNAVYVVNSTFGGQSGYGNTCANGGGISSIGVSYTLINSLFTHDSAIGHGASNGEGGNGGAIYSDGDTFTLSLCGTRVEDNRANEGGSAIFSVTNDGTGSLLIKDSVLRRNPRIGFDTEGFPGIFVQPEGPRPQVTNSTIE